MSALGWTVGTGGVMFIVGLILSAFSGPTNESDAAFLIVVGVFLFVVAGILRMVFA